jgi:DNA invertase Pin-like site-specific DNA recombinase
VARAHGPHVHHQCGDVLALWRLDRLGRSLKHLIDLTGALEDQGIRFHSVTESVDATTPGGKLVFHIFGALAEFERNLTHERTYARLAAARARGRKGGRRKKLGEKQRAVAVDLYRQKKHTIDELCHTVGISRPTHYKYVAAAATDRPRPIRRVLRKVLNPPDTG